MDADLVRVFLPVFTDLRLDAVAKVAMITKLPFFNF
jgi:hypothetical protein